MRLSSICALLCTMTLAMIALAQQPAAPEQAIKYPLTNREGPWLIHIGSFRGDEAYDFALRFAEETRSKHKLLTFIFSMHEADAIRDREELRKRQLEMIGSDKVAGSDEKIKLRTVRVIKEYSVFVGNFSDMEKARVEAERIKDFPPPTSIPTFGIYFNNAPTARLREDPNRGTASNLFRMKSDVVMEEGKRLAQTQGNPYAQAFVAKNPLAFKTNAAVVQNNPNAPVPMDPTWKALNEREQYSIFTCPKNWTLVVAQFSPPSEVSSTSRNSVVQTGYRTSNKELGKGLEDAARTARQLADILRDGGKGYDAYVFHTREYSLVTVGAFESRYDPKMEQAWTILKDFAASQSNTNSPFSLLMPIPRPMQIPGR